MGAAMIARVALLVALACLPRASQAQAGPVIGDFSPAALSFGGKTRLTITGSALFDAGDPSTTVTVGSVSCTVISYYSSSTRLVCEMEAWQEGTATRNLPLTLTVPTGATATACCLAFSADATPVVVEVRQGGELLANTVQLVGSSKGAMGSLGPQDLPTVSLGGTVCRVVDEEGEEAFKVESGIFRLNCTLPGPSQPARSSNATVDWGSGSAWPVGAALVTRGAYRAGPGNQPYLVQVVPEVTSVAPRTGSAGGGQLLTIRGSRFPPSIDAGNVEVAVGGHPCTVVSTSPSEITCLTASQAGAQEAPNAPWEPLFEQTGRHPGGRGIELARFGTPSGFSGSLRPLASWQPAPGNATLVTDVMRALPTLNSNMLSRLQAFFVAPSTGQYRFYISSDDRSELWGSRLLPNGTTTSKLMCSVSGWASYSPATGYEWSKFAAQESQAVDLVAGEHMLLEAYAEQYSGADHLAVGVRVPSAIRQWNSVPEVQRVQVSVAQYGQQQEVEVTAYQAGVTALTASVSCGNNETALLFGAAVDASGGGSDTGSGSYECRWYLSEAVEDLEACLREWLDIPAGALEARLTGSPPSTASSTQACGEESLLELVVAVAPGHAALTASLAVQLAEADGPASLLSSFAVAQQGLGGTVDVQTSANLYAYRTVPINATAAQLADAVNQLTAGLPKGNASASASTVSRGLRSGFRWRLTFPAAARDAVPAISLEASLASGLGVKASAALVRPASVPLSGSFQLGLPGAAESAEVAYNATATDVKAALHLLPGVGIVDVSVADSRSNSTTYQISFDPLTSSACNMPQLVAAWQASLAGTSAAVAVTTAVEGSCDYYARPIPADMLRRPVSQPGVVSLRVNDVLASCTAADLADCAFTYLAPSASPTVTSLSSPTPLVGGSLVRINGTRLANSAGVTVLIGGTPCEVQTHTDTLLECTVAPNTTSGWRQLSVVLGSLGAPLWADSQPQPLLVETLALAAAWPQVLVQDVPVVLTLSGVAFDAAACAAHKVTLGDDPCLLLSCNASALSCAVTPTSSGMRNVSLELTDGDGNATLATALLSGAQVQVLSGGTASPRILAIIPDILPSAGGLLELELEGFASEAEVLAVSLHPAASPTAAALGSSASIASWDWVQPGVLSVLVLPAAAGHYTVLVELVGGLVLASASTVELALSVDSVSPSLGSFGGGTIITISGMGFTTDDAGLLTRQQRLEPVVLLHVPMSTSHPNAVQLCDVEEANATYVACRTRPYCSAHASAEDPSAVACSPGSSPPAAVEVVLCPAKWTTKDVLKLYCWSQPDSPRAPCPQGGCNFSYDAPSTPRISSLAPSVAFAGGTLELATRNADSNTRVAISAAASAGSPQLCNVTSVAGDGGSLSCTLPDLPAGRYTVGVLRLNTAGDLEQGVGSQPVVYPATVDSLLPQAGSLAGGTLLRLRGSGAGFNATHPAANRVLLGGALPCTSVAASGSELSCITQSALGLVTAHYFQLPMYLSWSQRGFPSDFLGLTPVVRTFERGLSQNWGAGAPAGVQQTDYFAGRFSGAFYLPAGGNFSFNPQADDSARLTLDGQVVTSSQVLSLEAGAHPFSLEFFEFRGSASVGLTYKPAGQQWQAIPPAMLLPFLPDASLPVEVSVNGVPAVAACSGGDAEGCHFALSLEATPTLQAVAPQQLRITPALINVTGSGFGTDSQQLTLTVGGQPCVLQGTLGDSAATCLAPALPAGIYAVEATVAGKGRAMAAAPVSAQYLTAATGISPASGSLFGGTQVQVSGYGFAPTDPAAAQGRVPAVALGTLPCNVSAATGTSINCTTVSSGLSATTSVSLRVESRNASTGAAISGSAAVNSSTPFRYAASHTPLLLSVEPSTLSPHSQTTLTVSWSAPNASVLAAGLPSGASMAAIQLIGGLQEVACGVPSLLAANVSAGAYREQAGCVLPGLPAGRYSLRLLASPLGFSNSSTLSIPLLVSSISPPAGSLAGGTLLNITGSGFSDTPSEVAVSVGSSPCAVLASTAGWVSCRTAPFPGSLAANGSGATSGPLSLFIKPSSAGAELAQDAVPGVTYEYAAALTPTVTSISPGRGSTEGGTPVLITGTGFGAGNASSILVSVGQWACASVQVLNDTAITCVTSKPSTKSLQPLAVRVSVLQHGLAAGDVRYRYIDLWSRATTWGGSLDNIPLEGDSVLVPAGTYVLLDVSPPQLDALVLEGTLAFDDSLPLGQELRLDARRILINGGQLLIGSPEAPYNGSAVVTLHGDRSDTELPIYGTKCIGVRDGNLTIAGQPKLPTWTLLNATADEGDTAIVVNGALNWQVGDEILIASSSILPDDVDEAVVAAIEPLPSGNTRLVLDRALRYTHLGVVLAVEGEERVVDMRAEVAVLTRNVVVQGDWGSNNTQFGAHILMHSPKHLQRARLLLSHVEIRRAGQTGGLGRYPVHMHLHGDGSDSFLQGCSIHHTYQRAVTLHGTNNSKVLDCVAYEVAGHAYFTEDGIEQGNTLAGNLAVLTRRLDVGLNTDTTPASFWITNPANHVYGNRAAGSEAYGFWYRLLDHPEGPSATLNSCPKFTPLGTFRDNVAHSNLFYGLRIHPEFYPSSSFCGVSAPSMVPAVFQGLTAYKNGVKGVVATQVGLVQFHNFSLADNGAGPVQHIVNGKDNGGAAEMSWVVDSRRLTRTPLEAMAGLQGALIIARTTEGQQGTAGYWPRPSRGVRGITTQSAPMGDPSHAALFAAINVTFVGFTGGDYYALEACGKCKHLQGGFHSFFRGIRFIQDGAPALASWSYPHQGIMKDTDGSLLRQYFGGQANGTLHAAHDMLRLQECTLVAGAGAVCRPGLEFRRIMLNSHSPWSLHFRDLLLTDATTNATTPVIFTAYNEEGYQFTVPADANRTYWLHWTGPPVDPTQIMLHKLDRLEREHGVMLQLRYLQEPLAFSINGNRSALTAVPDPAAARHGAQFFERRSVMGDAAGGLKTDGGYNASALWLFAQGDTSSTLLVRSEWCPEGGCTPLPANPPDQLPGQVLWSKAPWPGGALPQAGSNVTIPSGWDVLLDISPPQLDRLSIRGNLTFSDQPLTLHAGAIVVHGSGRLSVGTESQPVRSTAAIVLSGNRGSPEWPVAAGCAKVGYKVLAVLDSGRLELHGASTARRWTRLASSAAAGDTQVALAEAVDWPVGSDIVLASTSFNPQQAETIRVRGVSGDGRMLQLAAPLAFNHTAILKQYSSGASIDMRGEVGLLTSNVVVRSSDGPAQLASATAYRDRFGCRLLAAGAAVARVSGVAFQYCGQAGIERAAVQVELTSPLEPSYLRRSSTVNSMDAAVRILGSAGPVSVTGCVLLGSYDAATLLLDGSGHSVVGNLGLGTTKIDLGTSSFDTDALPTFYVKQSGNTIQGNAAAGSDRMGFKVAGDPCLLGRSGARFANNSAHTSLVGLDLSANTAGAACTQAVDFAAYLTWDFGLITIKGITTDVQLYGMSFAENKHAGALVLRTAGMTERAEVRFNGGLFAGQSPATCALCSRLGAGSRDAGCPPKLTRVSYNNPSSSLPPWSASIGLVAVSFALDWTVGPERKPYDAMHGYNTIHGVAYVNNVTFADFPGTAGAAGGCSAGQFAISNHALSVDAAHPHFFSGGATINSPGLFQLTGPKAEWRNEADCGTASYKLPDGSQLPLNCQGPRHSMFRDVDGSLTGTRGTVVGTSAGWPRPPFAQQGPLAPPGTCSPSAAFDGYFCPLVDSGGGAVDPQLLVLESRDDDSESRNFSPVILQGPIVAGSANGTTADLLVTAMDQGWCFAYTCQMRLSTFWAAVATGHAYRMTFSGTASKVFRLWLPYAPPGGEVVLALNYSGDPQRRYVWSAATQSRVAPLDQPPLVADGSGHGAYHWDQGSATVTVKLGGGGNLEIRTERVIRVNARLNLDINQFYDTKELFVANMAYLLGIDPARIRIVSITAGSTVVDYAVAEDPAVADQPLPDPSFDTSGNVDAGTGQEVAALIGGMTPEEQLQLQQQVLGNTSTSNRPPPPPAAAGPPPPPASTGPDLASVLLLLKASIVDGSFEAAAGASLLGLTLELPSDPGGPTNSTTTLTLDDILAEAGGGGGGGAPSKGLPLGGIVGIAVGCSVAACLLVMAALFLVRGRGQGAWLPKAGRSLDLESPRFSHSTHRGRTGRVHPEPFSGSDRGSPQPTAGLSASGGSSLHASPGPQERLPHGTGGGYRAVLRDGSAPPSPSADSSAPSSPSPSASLLGPATTQAGTNRPWRL